MRPLIAAVDTHGEYPDIVRAVAAEQGVPLVDMHRSTAVDGLLAADVSVGAP